MSESDPTDPELLAEWLDHRRERAFRDLVARDAGLVYAAARRTTCGDATLAAEAAQLTFITLVHKAKSLAGRGSLAGWLHQTAVLQASTLRRQARREDRKRQQLHATMHADSSSNEDAWRELAPGLDTALAALPEKDREALLLRFYRALSVKEVAATLGIATDAAQKRIDRATARLRNKLVRRGLTTGGSLSAVMLAGFATDTQAAAFAVPIFTAKAVAAGAVGSGTLSTTTAFLTASAMKTTSVAVPLVILLVGGVWLVGQFRSIAELQERNTLLTNHLAADARVDFPASKAVASSISLSEGKTIDWETVGERLISENERYGDTGSRVPGGRWYERLGERLDEMSPGQLSTALDQIAATGLSTQARMYLELGVFWRLGKKEPEMALDRLVDRCGDSDWAGFCGDVFEGWLKGDREPATAWFDRQLVAVTTRHHEDEPQSRNGGSRVAGYPELAKLALDVHPVWNRPLDFLDGLLIRLLEHDQAGNHRELAKTIAEKLSDGTQRATYLEKFK